MTRTGHPRVRRAMPGLVSPFAAVVMLVLVLAASVLVSAGSPHHARPTATVVTAVHSQAHEAVQISGHEHMHGNDWAPTLSKRLRPAAPAALLGIVPARLTEPGAAPGPAVVPIRAAPGDRLIFLSVLRV